MPNNDLANLHFLSDEDTLSLEYHYNTMITIIDRIKRENQLRGNWTLSADFKWLVKEEVN